MRRAVRIVLVETTHAGNIGAVARAMKNMGFDELVLVNPCKFRTYDAYARASGANDIIDNATVVESLPDALKECTLVFGTSARTRNMSWEDASLRNAVQSLESESDDEKLAVVFGRERSGLTNEELAYCHRLVYIPTEVEFASLNLAAAVQLVVYELSMFFNVNEIRVPENNVPAAAMGDMERFYVHLEETLVELEFLDPDNPRLLMRRLRRFYNRSRPDKEELGMLRGILSAANRLKKMANL